MALAAAGLLAYAPLLLLLTALWPAHYLRHRQPLVAALKVLAGFLATLLPEQFVSSRAGIGGAAATAGPPGELLLRTAAALSVQLALHALGEWPLVGGLEGMCPST
jgi:hypothetical protein